jgi:Domain of unknown function (DUF5069)
VTVAAKNLREVEPAAFGVELDGYAHLPRMLDKARATLARSAGDYMSAARSTTLRRVDALLDGEPGRVFAGPALFSAIVARPAAG